MVLEDLPVAGEVLLVERGHAVKLVVQPRSSYLRSPNWWNGSSCASRTPIGVSSRQKASRVGRAVVDPRNHGDAHQ